MEVGFYIIALMSFANVQRPQFFKSLFANLPIDQCVRTMYVVCVYVRVYLYVCR